MAGPPQPSPRPGLIDTTILVGASRKKPDAVNFLTAVSAGGPPPVSVVAVMELYVGARDARDLATLQSFIASYFTVASLTDAASLRALGLVVQFTLSYGLEVPDALIAATALKLGLPIYTLNTKHFQMIPGLTVLKPY